jgi:RAD51-like protein 2
MAKAFVQHIQSMDDGSGTHDFATLTPESILSNIMLYRVHDYVEQIALLNMLSELLQGDMKQVRLIIIDTVAFHFRHEFDDMNQRTRLLLGMAQRLLELAERHSVAVCH